MSGALRSVLVILLAALGTFLLAECLEDKAFPAEDNKLDNALAKLEDLGHAAAEGGKDDGIAFEEEVEGMGEFLFF